MRYSSHQSGQKPAQYHAVKTAYDLIRSITTFCEIYAVDGDITFTCKSAWTRKRKCNSYHGTNYWSTVFLELEYKWAQVERKQSVYLPYPHKIGEMFHKNSTQPVNILLFFKIMPCFQT